MNITLAWTDIAALSPFLLLLAGALSVLLVSSFCEKIADKFAEPLTIITLLIALYAAFYSPASDSPLLTPWIKFDLLGRVFTILFIIIGLGSTLLASAFFQRFHVGQGEFFFLLLSSIAGLILIGLSANFLTLFLGIETLSIPLYILCGYVKNWKYSHESAIKYFLIGSLGTGFLLYGVALIYGATGTTQLNLLLNSYQSISLATQKTLFLGGAALVTMGLCFKAAVVPFHVWAPDVYDGAPNPVTGFMAIGTKAGAFVAFIRVFMEALPQFNPHWNEAISLLAYPTLIYANIVALKQVQLRRFFAYSGISHAGFLLIPLAVGTPEAISPLLFYIVVYSLATFGCFAVMTYLDYRSAGVLLSDLKGLFYKSPILATIFVLCLLTLGGIPPTAGFFAKFYLFKVAFQAGYYGLVVVGLLTTILSAYYYLRIAAYLFAPSETNAVPLVHTWSAAVLGISSAALILFLSVYPAPLLSLLQLR